MSSLAYLVAGDTRLTLPINIYSSNWGYQENTMSMDTIGGRVVQLLSVQVTDLTIETVAGSRRELQRVAEGIRQVMQFHLKTELPAYFKVPSRKWSLMVYVEAMPQMGWDFTATSYPYTLMMAIAEDLTGVKTKQIEAAALERLAQGIGYNPSVHGGDPQGFAKIVKSVTGASAEALGPLGGTTQTEKTNQGNLGPGLTGKVDVTGLNGNKTTFEQWGASVLKAGGWPVCKNNLIYMVAWGNRENGLGRYNVLGTTVNGSVAHDFSSPEQGIATAVSFLNNGNYDPVVRDLAQCANYVKTGQDITASPWCYQCGDYILGIIHEVAKSYSSYANQVPNAFQ